MSQATAPTFGVVFTHPSAPLKLPVCVYVRGCVLCMRCVDTTVWAATIPILFDILITDRTLKSSNVQACRRRPSKSNGVPQLASSCSLTGELVPLRIRIGPFCVTLRRGRTQWKYESFSEKRRLELIRTEL